VTSASVVINYPSLEATIQKAESHPFGRDVPQFPIRPAGNLDRSFHPQFFAFAPDDRDGNFYLARSANFDHRGQRYLPGACTVCSRPVPSTMLRWLADRLGARET